MHDCNGKTTSPLHCPHPYVLYISSQQTGWLSAFISCPRLGLRFKQNKNPLKLENKSKYLVTVIFTRLVCIKSFSPSKEVAKNPLGRPRTTGDFWLSTQWAGHSSTKPVKDLEIFQILMYLGLNRKQGKEGEKTPGRVSLKKETGWSRLISLTKLMAHWEQNLHPPLELGFLQNMLLFISFNAGVRGPG